MHRRLLNEADLRVTAHKCHMQLCQNLSLLIYILYHNIFQAYPWKEKKDKSSSNGVMGGGWVRNKTHTAEN